MHFYDSDTYLGTEILNLSNINIFIPIALSFIFITTIFFKKKI